MDARERIARRAALELEDGHYVNLGIGLPTLISNHVPKGLNVILHTENGMLGYGPYPEEGAEDPDLINAGKETVTELPGCSYFNSTDSFALVRGGHLDVTFLGAFEVSASGDIANWMIPGKKVKGMGGAMDIVAGTKKVVVLMPHVNKKGESKILKECRLPLTGKGVVDRIITDWAVFDVTPKGLLLQEKHPDIDLEDLRSKTLAPFEIAAEIKPYLN